MNQPIRIHASDVTPAPIEATVTRGLSAAIDAVAEAAPTSHRFLRRQWFAAALDAYGGEARTLVARVGGVAALALPLVARGPTPARIAALPGCYWPFRSFPVAAGLADDALLDAALDALAREVRAVRIGPVPDGDAAVAPLVARARARGWGVVERQVATSFLLDIAAAEREGAWPRASTLKKNRFHEKHLAAHGALAWSFVASDAWEPAFDAMADVERRSWLGERTDGRDAKFTADGHGAFFRAAARDPAIAAMFHAALLHVDGVPAAFSFDLNAGALKYAIANSYDPAFAKHSPGKLLYWRNLADARARGTAIVDWGAGDSGYKRVIGAEQGPAIRDWLLLRPGLPARLARVVRRLWRAP